MEEYSFWRARLRSVPRGSAAEKTPAFWKVTFKNSMLFDTFCKNFKRNRYFWSQMLENTMKNQCFFMKFQQALCRINIFERKTLKYNRKLMFWYDNQWKSMRIHENPWHTGHTNHRNVIFSEKKAPAAVHHTHTQGIKIPATPFFWKKNACGSASHTHRA